MPRCGVVSAYSFEWPPFKNLCTYFSSPTANKSGQARIAPFVRSVYEDFEACRSPPSGKVRATASRVCASQVSPIVNLASPHGLARLPGRSMGTRLSSSAPTCSSAGLRAPRPRAVTREFCFRHAMEGSGGFRRI